MTATGAVMRTTPAHTELERWYRRLLRAYPVGYRRVHGDEILATLMDCAEPGRRRPARADVVDLARGAVRQWFRLPVGWSAVVAAVLSALVVGAMDAAVGSWLAWQTAAELPSDSVALQTAQTVAGAPFAAPHVNRPPGWRLNYWHTVEVSNHDPQGLPGWTLQAAQARLRAEGWTIGNSEGGVPDSRGGAKAVGMVQTFVATRDGHVLLANALSPFIPEGSGTTVSTSIYPVTPSGEPVAILLGWLLGTVTGWLLTGWVSYRLRRRALRLRVAAVALGLGTLWSAIGATTDLYRMLGRLAFTDPGVEPPYPSYGSVLGHPEQVALTLALGVTILVLAGTARRRLTAAEAA